MQIRLSQDDSYVLTLTCDHLIAETTERVRVIVDSLDIEIQEFVSIIEESFREDAVSFPRIGRAVVDISIPAGTDVVDFIAGLARKIQCTILSMAPESPDTDVE